jgi:hypothetical protein
MEEQEYKKRILPNSIKVDDITRFANKLAYKEFLDHKKNVDKVSSGISF